MKIYKKILIKKKILIIFNLLLNIYYNRNESNYEGHSFNLLEILILYDYVFIRDNIKNAKTKQAIFKYICKLLNIQV